MRIRPALGLVAVLAVMAAACGEEIADDPAATAPPPTSPVTTSPVNTSPVGSDVDALAGKSWVGRSISDGSGPRPVIAGSEPTIAFSADGTAVSGSTGCNSYSGDVTIGRRTMSVSRIEVTERGCVDDGVMDQEALFLAIFQGVDAFTLVDGVLELHASEGSVSFVEPEAIVDASLGGAAWSLDTLVAGETASSILTTTLPVLRVDLESGSLRGTTGCNDFGGSLQVVGSEFITSDLSWTEIGCEQAVMTQEAFILDVLQNAERYEIEGDRLTISTGSGRALIYRAG